METIKVERGVVLGIIREEFKGVGDKLITYWKNGKSYKCVPSYMMPISDRLKIVDSLNSKYDGLVARIKSGPEYFNYISVQVKGTEITLK